MLIHVQVEERTKENFNDKSWVELEYNLEESRLGDSGVGSSSEKPSCERAVVALNNKSRLTK